MAISSIRSDGSIAVSTSVAWPAESTEARQASGARRCAKAVVRPSFVIRPWAPGPTPA